MFLRAAFLTLRECMHACTLADAALPCRAGLLQAELAGAEEAEQRGDGAPSTPASPKPSTARPPSEVSLRRRPSRSRTSLRWRRCSAPTMLVCLIDDMSMVMRLL